MTKCVTFLIHEWMWGTLFEDWGSFQLLLDWSTFPSHFYSLFLSSYSYQILHRETLMNTITQSLAEILSLQLAPTFNFLYFWLMHLQNSKTFCWALILKCPPQSSWCCIFRPHSMLAATPASFHWENLKQPPAPPILPRIFPCHSSMPGGGYRQPSNRPGDATGPQHNIRMSLQ